MTSMLESFVIEARESLEHASETILALEHDPHDSDKLGDLFRSIHTVKGTAGMFENMEAFHRLAHTTEDGLDQLRSGAFSITSEYTDLLFAVLDQLNAWLDHLDTHGVLPASAAPDSQGLIDRLIAHKPAGDAIETDTVSARAAETAPDRGSITAPSALPDWIENLPEAWRTRAEQDSQTTPETRIFAIRYTPAADSFMCGADPLATVRALPGLIGYQVDARQPWAGLEAMAPYDCNLVFDILTSAERDVVKTALAEITAQCEVNEIAPEALVPPEQAGDDEDALEALFDALSADFADNDPQSEPAPPASPNQADAPEADELPTERPAGAPEPERRPQTPPGEDAKPQADNKPLRVEQHRIDELMTLAGELIVAKNALPFLAKRIGDGDDRDELVRELKANQADLDRIADRIQSAVMSARMVPVSSIFQRFPRLVRDISRKLEKDVELVMEGENTEADKNIIAGLADPLIHLVRNSLDHGLETPAERRAAGKPGTGRIVLRAKALDDQVLIEVGDDGGGIDPARIKQKAFDKDLIDAQTRDSISDQDALQLVLLAGFSTADNVSDLSGRGVGMDAVKSAVNNVGGHLLIESEIGVGTTMRILLPMSMAVARVLLVDIDGQRYGVPMSLIRETVRLHRDKFDRVKHNEVILLRDQLISIHRGRALLGLDDAAPNASEQAVLILEIDNQTVGVVVDEFLQSVDIVQKPMAGVMAQYDIYAGSALTGDGQVLLVLNLPTMLRRASQAAETLPAVCESTPRVIQEA
ncbi:chemotaxis protein CheA [Salinisphaera sp. Q1T1-3]|uniref:chemotaxis protein CheA n=1 Tax=Salinisphaera sp. Q1T1-3 TaxID=2321229 RepID=UPI000E749B00|nr:chemotaxis protein CheA [Salinisphaera sp. Q1T1-3]RJS91599.1 chemotaxis protein CheA [Salinisphaera sp. Q1T1-3]